MKKSGLPEGYQKFGDHYFIIEHDGGFWTIQTVQNLPGGRGSDWQHVAGPFYTYSEVRIKQLELNNIV